MDFPLLAYKYYRCIDTETLEELPVSPGTNNMVRVTFPGGYSGTIRIRFEEPWFWRLAEAVSFVAVAAAVALWVFDSKLTGKVINSQKSDKKYLTKKSKKSVDK